MVFFRVDRKLGASMWRDPGLKEDERKWRSLSFFLLFCGIALLSAEPVFSTGGEVLVSGEGDLTFISATVTWPNGGTYTHDNTKSVVKATGSQGSLAVLNIDVTGAWNFPIATFAVGAYAEVTHDRNVDFAMPTIVVESGGRFIQGENATLSTGGKLEIKGTGQFINRGNYNKPLKFSLDGDSGGEFVHEGAVTESITIDPSISSDSPIYLFTLNGGSVAPGKVVRCLGSGNNTATLNIKDTTLSSASVFGVKGAAGSYQNFSRLIYNRPEGTFELDQLRYYDGQGDSSLDENWLVGKFFLKAGDVTITSTRDTRGDRFYVSGGTLKLAETSTVSEIDTLTIYGDSSLVLQRSCSMDYLYASDSGSSGGVTLALGSHTLNADELTFGSRGTTTLLTEVIIENGAISSAGKITGANGLTLSGDVKLSPSVTGTLGTDESVSFQVVGNTWANLTQGSMALSVGDDEVSVVDGKAVAQSALFTFTLLEDTDSGDGVMGYRLGITGRETKDLVADLGSVGAQNIEGLRQAVVATGGSTQMLDQADVPTLRSIMNSLRPDVTLMAEMAGVMNAFEESRQVVSSHLVRYREDDTNGRKKESWARAFGRCGDERNHGAVAAYDTELWGVAAGADLWVGRRYCAGVALTGARSDTDLTASQAQADVESLRFALYGIRNFGAPYVSGALSGSVERYETQRRVESFGVAHAEFSGQTASAALESGWDIFFGSQWTLTPYCGAEFLVMTSESHTESGAGAAGLNIDRSKTEIFRTTLGLRMGGRLGDRLTCFVDGAWLHDGSGVDVTRDAAYSATGTPLVLETVKRDRDRFRGALKIESVLTQASSLSADVSWIESDHTDSFSGSFVVRYVFP